MTDSEWIFEIMHPDDVEVYNFIERVGIILDSIKNPTEEQVSAARNQAFLEIL